MPCAATDPSQLLTPASPLGTLTTPTPTARGMAVKMSRCFPSFVLSITEDIKDWI